MSLEGWGGGRFLHLHFLLALADVLPWQFLVQDYSGRCQPHSCCTRFLCAENKQQWFRPRATCDVPLPATCIVILTACVVLCVHSPFWLTTARGASCVHRSSAWFYRWREAMVSVARLALATSWLFAQDLPISSDIAGKESVTGFVLWGLVVGGQAFR
jgi:hypothetical protein